MDRKPSPWHSLTAQSALDTLDTTEAGLDEQEAGSRLAEHGPNRLPEAAKRAY
ncbi:MAG: cation-transporting P-type ATPase [Pseudomonadota bacterium]